MMTVKLGEENLLYQKMFDKQIIFSMDESVFSAQYFHKIFSDGTIMRYVPKAGTLFIAVPKTNEYYSTIKYDLMKNNIPFNENEILIQIKLKAFNFNKEKREKLKEIEREITNIPNVLFYPSVIYNNQRLYFLIHYNSSSSKDLIKNILKMNEIFLDYSANSFIIEEISQIKPLSYFLSKYNVNFDDLFYMELIAEYSGEIPEVKDQSYLYFWPYNDRGELKIVPFELMVYFGESALKPIYDFGSKLIGAGLPIIYFEGSQLENYRKYIIINVRQRMEIYYELFNSLIEEGYKIKIERLEKIEKEF